MIVFLIVIYSKSLFHNNDLALKLSEPTTSITDFLLAAELFVFAFLTFWAVGDQCSILLWGIALFLLGLSALAGGLYHGISANLFLWRMTAVCIVATLGFMIAAGIVSVTSGTFRIALLLAAELPLLILVFRLAMQQKSSVQVPHSRKRIVILLIALAITLAFQIYTGGAMVGIWLLVGSLIILTGVWIQQAEISPHKHFNHNDLCHIFFMVGVYFLYRAGLLFKDH